MRRFRTQKSVNQPVTRSALRGLRIAQCCRTSNDEAHADMDTLSPDRYVAIHIVYRYNAPYE